MRIAVDLHMHSCLSPCGDESMTPYNIAAMASIKGLDVIAVADHNTCGNARAVSTACARFGVTLLPAMEVTSREEVHLLCYFPSLSPLEAFGREIYAHLPDVKNREAIFGPQVLMDAEDRRLGLEERMLLGAVQLSAEQVQALALEHGGVMVPAHINKHANSWLDILGFLPPQMGLHTLEVFKRAPVPAYVKLESYRVLHNSDAHQLEDILEQESFLEVDEVSAPALVDLFASPVTVAHGN